MDELRRQVEELLARVAEGERENAQLRKRIDELQACHDELRTRNAELEAAMKRRGKKYRPKANAKTPAKKTPDRRKQPHRKHPGVFREPPLPGENTIEHDVRRECCPHCGGEELEDTGRFDEHLVEEIPEPSVELHRC